MIGAGAETVYRGFLLLVAGIPVFALMRWISLLAGNEGVVGLSPPVGLTALLALWSLTRQRGLRTAGGCSQ